MDEDQGRRQRADGMWRAYSADTMWRAYSLDTTIEGARSLFEKRFGVEPEECFACGPIILAGPIAVERGGNDGINHSLGSDSVSSARV